MNLFNDHNQTWTDAAAYRRLPPWWPSLCPGYGSSFPVISSSSRLRCKRCCSEALRWLVSLGRCCVSVHRKKKKSECIVIQITSIIIIKKSLHIYQVLSLLLGRCFESHSRKLVTEIFNPLLHYFFRNQIYNEEMCEINNWIKSI